MLAMTLISMVKTYVDAVTHSRQIDGVTKERIIRRAIADVQDLRPSVGEFEASRADETLKGLQALVVQPSA
jgi:hypothetical protein